MVLTILRAIVHYGLHFGAPFLFAQLYKGERKIKAFWILMATILIDLDHLLATPMFNPYRCSVGFHPLHSYFMVAIYVLMCVLPLQKLHLPWWIRPLGIGLLFHILTDLQDFYLWQQWLMY
ncbi:hypothetical protein HMPREF0653_00673 [Prevotella disiens JCM 6334 = ATCC 29426]|jgi:hypothetical protein|uniref:Membrane protein n=3 Tax=Prevotella disiens TaxID=28130 RepID=A0A096C460_9BACT|nr:DUF6122 family protein [Prevotella disiens]ERJ79338.1 hypothetical protein HMPREF0653_00673 [Prevotella disiens JCM 6334 = ATCC 29426]KGF49732.1 membrane protein [Prevotella disiens DNF00882]SUB84687.1 Uncharacterised protein [Prevotella disiens]